MHFVVLILLVLIVVFGPRLWANHALKKHGGRRDDLDFTGTALAQHLLDGLQIDGVGVEDSPGGDHYDPRSKTVRLSKGQWDEQSLTAIVVAAHEVGHAIQDAHGYPPLKTRTQLVLGTQWIQRLGVFLMMAIPVVGLLTRSPRLSLLTVLVGLVMMGSSFVVHLVTLPVEWDASFRRALPLLERKSVPLGGFKGGKDSLLGDKDRPAAREILTACALTYVASSLASLLNLWRWIAILRR